MRDKVAGNDDYAVTVDDLRRYERRHGRIPRGAAVIAWTGWDARWGTPAYANLDADGVIHQPGFSIEAAQWLVDNRKLDVRGALGTDTFGPDLGIDDTFAVSVLLYDQHRISLENLTNLAALPATGRLRAGRRAHQPGGLGLDRQHHRRAAPGELSRAPRPLATGAVVSG